MRNILIALYRKYRLDLRIPPWADPKLHCFHGGSGAALRGDSQCLS